MGLKSVAQPLMESKETVMLYLGTAILATAGPFVVLQVALCTLWEAVDRRTVNFIGLCSRASQALAAPCKFLVKNEADGFIVHLLVWLGAVLPAWFFYELYLSITVGFSWKRVMVYNLVRIGPMYMNFMYCYVMCHKEAHNYGNLFVSPYNSFLKYVFNHWVGLFNGVVPGAFTYAHVYNHHKYDNCERDIISTAFRPRDEFSSWVRYVPEFFAYACNLSSVFAFWSEGRYRFVGGIILSTIWYVLFVGTCWFASPMFTLFTLIYAFVEANILLSVVNFVWHAFIDPDDPSNDYINSTTIIEGLNFTLAEEYHVVHHQYAGAHWTQHSELYFKHMESYKACVPSVFYKQNIFEVFGMIVSKDYTKLAQIYYKPFLPKGITEEDLAQLLKKRLQCHGLALARSVGRTNKAKAGG